MPETPFFTLLPGHDLAYNELVRPARRWAFSYYYLYRWLPLLHPQQAMLVQVLRQCTWQQGKPTGRCQLANATLCRLMGWSETSHKTLLAELERPLTDWFIERARTRKRHVTEGHGVEGAPRYRLRMDEPLTPQDQAALEALLAKQSPATPYEGAEILAALAQQRTRDLWAQLDEQPQPATLPTRPATVAEIARRAWPHLPAEAVAASRPLAESAEQCQLRLTGVGYAHMELDYLLRGWLPHLGINQTWLVIALRARCFHDPLTGETRDTVTVSRRELEGQLGIPSRTFRRILRDEVTLPLFHISPAGEPADPATPRHLPHRGDIACHVAYPLLPISPLHQDQYEARLLDRQAALSTTGQAAPLNVASQPRRLGEVIHERPECPAEKGQPTRVMASQAASQPRSTRPARPAESPLVGQSTPLNMDSQPTILSSNKSNQLILNQTNTPHDPSGREGGGKEAIRRLLEPFGIQGLERILQNPWLTPAEVRGWLLKGQAEVTHEQMAGFLFRRLTATSSQSEELPALYRLAGEVEEEEEQLFVEWWLTETSAPPFTGEAQRERYGAWLKVVKGEAGNPDRPDYSPHACWRREMARLSYAPPPLAEFRG